MATGVNPAGTSARVSWGAFWGDAPPPGCPGVGLPVGTDVAAVTGKDGMVSKLAPKMAKVLINPNWALKHIYIISLYFVDQYLDLLFEVIKHINQFLPLG